MNFLNKVTYLSLAVLLLTSANISASATAGTPADAKTWKDNAYDWTIGLAKDHPCITGSLAVAAGAGATYKFCPPFKKHVDRGLALLKGKTQKVLGLGKDKLNEMDQQKFTRADAAVLTVAAASVYGIKNDVFSVRSYPTGKVTELGTKSYDLMKPVFEKITPEAFRTWLEEPNTNRMALLPVTAVGLAGLTAYLGHKVYKARKAAAPVQ